MVDAWPRHFRCRADLVWWMPLRAASAVRHDLGQRNRNHLPDPGIAPSTERPIDRVPVAALERNVAPGRNAAQPLEYAD